MPARQLSRHDLSEVLQRHSHLSENMKERILSGRCALTDNDGSTVYLAGSSCYFVNRDYVPQRTATPPPQPVIETEDEREARERAERLAAIPSHDAQEWLAKHQATAAPAPTPKANPGVAFAAHVRSDAEPQVDIAALIRQPSQFVRPMPTTTPKTINPHAGRATVAAIFRGTN